MPNRKKGQYSWSWLYVILFVCLWLAAHNCLP